METLKENDADYRIGDYRASLVNPENLFWVPQPDELVTLLKKSDKKSIQDEHLIRLLRKRSNNPDHGNQLVEVW